MKRCNRCGEEKDVNSYNIRRASRDGLTSTCKDCNKEKCKKYKEENKEKISAYNKKYQSENYYIGKYSGRDKDRYLTEEYQSWLKSYKENNREKLKNDRRLFYLNNKKYFLSYRKNRCENDKVYHLSIIIRTMISNSISSKNFTKRSRTQKILGCTFVEIKLYLESKFESWMTWDNYGKYNGELNYGWDIDHIVPISSAKTEEDIIELNHFTNLQPLCSYTNRHIKKDNLL